MNYRNSPNLLRFATSIPRQQPLDSRGKLQQLGTAPLPISTPASHNQPQLFELKTPTVRDARPLSHEPVEQGSAVHSGTKKTKRVRVTHINSPSPHRENLAESHQDVVVLLHGLFATTRSMRKVAMMIQSQGYQVENWGYPTFLKSIESNVETLLPKLHALESNSSIRSIHFVTHSLGGILARCALERSSFTKIKRLVMLAPPNAGSHLTRLSLGPFKRFLPVIGEISESPNSLPNRLRQPKGVEVGVIAASSDFIVHVANTMLSYQADHCVVQASHFELPSHAEAIQKVLNFLQLGRFNPATTFRATIASRKMAA